MLHEVGKFQRLLNLENDFLVAYWEQRGCDHASEKDAHSASLRQQIDDLRTVLRWSPFPLMRRQPAAALRNMNVVLAKLLPEVASVDLLARPPRVTVPVHYVFGEQDALTTASMANELAAAITTPGSTLIRLPNAGHMVHFDQPAILRSIAVNA